MSYFPCWFAGAAVAIAVAAGGCGGGPPALSPAEFRVAADRICRDTDRPLMRADASTSGPSTLERRAEVFQRERERLGAVRVPMPLRADFEKLLAAFDERVRLTRAAPPVSSGRRPRAGEIDRLATYLQAGARNEAEIARLVRPLGLRVCGRER